MALVAVTSGTNATALSVQQIINLLTGVMTDQPVYVANTIRATTTGATAFAAFAGGTASGAPTTGTHAKGEFILDQTGSFWLCTTAGTPGTWIQAGAVDTTSGDYASLVAAGASAVAGSTGKAADAGHQHPGLVNAGSGFVGNLLLLQLNGVNKLSVDQTGHAIFGARVGATGLDLTADIAGVTSIVMAGALSGVTTISMSGALSGATSLSATNLTGTLQTAAQPNVTSLGTLSSLAMSGALTGPTTGAFSSSLTALWMALGSTPYTPVGGDLIVNRGGSDPGSGLIGFGSKTAEGNYLFFNGDYHFRRNGATANLEATLTTAAQPNVTSVGTLTALDTSAPPTFPSYSGATWTGTHYQGTLGWGNQARQLFTALTRDDSKAIEGDILFNI